MVITINGEELELPQTSTVDSLIELKSLNRDRVIFQLNGDIIKKEHYQTTELRPNAVVEIMALVGGG